MTADNGQTPETVTRYTPVLIGISKNQPKEFSGLHPDPTGHWVEYSDYAALELRLAGALREKVEAERRAAEARDAALDEARNAVQRTFDAPDLRDPDNKSYREGYEDGCTDSMSEIRALKSGGAGEVK